MLIRTNKLFNQQTLTGEQIREICALGAKSSYLMQKETDSFFVEQHYKGVHKTLGNMTVTPFRDDEYSKDYNKVEDGLTIDYPGVGAFTESSIAQVKKYAENTFK